MDMLGRKVSIIMGVCVVVFLIILFIIISLKAK